MELAHKSVRAKLGNPPRYYTQEVTFVIKVSFQVSPVPRPFPYIKKLGKIVRKGLRFGGGGGGEEGYGNQTIPGKIMI